MAGGIRSIDVETGSEGEYESVRIVFGPHYFIELHSEGADAVTFVLGATHHGFKADASAVGGQLESFINEVREAHPESAVD